MWPDGVVVVTPLLDQHLGLLQRVEDFSIEQLVPELSAEALVVAVLRLGWRANTATKRCSSRPGRATGWRRSGADDLRTTCGRLADSDRTRLSDIKECGRS